MGLLGGFGMFFGGSGGSSGGIQSIVPGRNITVDDTDPENPIVATTADDIIVVANYSALPSAASVPDEFYWCSESQGTAWLPGSLGGTYYSAGMYYSNGSSWEFLSVPYQATQAEVNTGTNNDKFVTPSTLTNADVILNKTAIELMFGTTTTFSPTDSTTYYLTFQTNLIISTTATLRQFQGISVTIFGIWLYVDPQSTLGSSEDVTFYLRNITDSTSSLLGVLPFDNRGRSVKSAVASPILMSTSKYYSVEMVTPAWTTNPTQVAVLGKLLCR